MKHALNNRNFLLFKIYFLIRIDKVLSISLSTHFIRIRSFHLLCRYYSSIISWSLTSLFITPLSVRNAVVIENIYTVNQIEITTGWERGREGEKERLVSLIRSAMACI